MDMQQETAPSAAPVAPAKIDESIAENFLRLIADSQSNGVPEMHFRLWNRCSDEIRRKYIESYRKDPKKRAWVAEGYLAGDPDFDELIKLPDDTLGHLYAKHVIDNNLNRKIASMYKAAHDGLDQEGKLHGMPEEAKYAVVRGFQLHDVLHIITGYLTTGYGEMALQAFTLAQSTLPYSASWMATLTAQMTFVNPDMTVPVMDALSEGWRLGRRAKNLNFTKWEERFDEPVARLREEYELN